jgi:hypothetical protein
MQVLNATAATPQELARPIRLSFACWPMISGEPSRTPKLSFSTSPNNPFDGQREAKATTNRGSEVPGFCPARLAMKRTQKVAIAYDHLKGS